MSTTNIKYERTIRNGRRWGFKPITGLMRVMTDSDMTMVADGSVLLIESEHWWREFAFDGKRLVPGDGYMKTSTEGMVTETNSSNYALY